MRPDVIKIENPDTGEIYLGEAIGDPEILDRGRLVSILTPDGEIKTGWEVER